MDLAIHLPRIALFWQVTLLHTGDYVGRPMQLHRQLADTAGLTVDLFERWLQIWHTTIDAMFTGPVADRAKSDAVRMAAGMARAISGASSAMSLPLASADPSSGRSDSSAGPPRLPA